MKASKINSQEDRNTEREAPLKGTWLSVGIVGGVILLTYIWFFWIFMDRV